MPISINKLGNEAIMIITVIPPAVVPDDPIEATQAILDFQAEKGGTVVRITDYTQVKLSFGNIAQGMASDAAFQNPKVKSIIVGTDALVKMAAEAFKQDQYGKVNVPIFASIDEAVNAARKALK